MVSAKDRMPSLFEAFIQIGPEAKDDGIFLYEPRRGDPPFVYRPSVATWGLDVSDDLRAVLPRVPLRIGRSHLTYQDGTVLPFLVAYSPGYGVSLEAV
jgi:hypothetical protein